MAQTNYTPISLYYSTTASAVPTAANLVPGELAINTNDGKLYYEDSSGVVRVLASKSTGSIGGSNTQVQFNNSGSLGGSSSLTWDGSALTTSRLVLGGTTLPSAGTATLFSRTSDNNTYLQTGSGNNFNLLDGSQNTMATFSPTVLNFNISNSEKMRINSDGQLLLGTTTALGTGKVGFLQSASGQVLTMQNSNAAPYGIACLYTGASPNSTISQYLYCDDTVGLRMEVRSNGGIANYTANNVILSDRREKTNFTPATPYLDKICAIPVQTFNYIDQNLEEDGGLTLGVVAQDVQAVAPELVSEGNWGSKENPKMRLEIYQTDMQYALMKALQELKAEFDAYKATHP